MSILWQVQAKTRAISEVEQQGAQIMDIILTQVRSTSVVNIPSSGLSSSTLSLATSTPGNNPIVFTLNNNNLLLSLGSNSVLPLNNNKIIISNLRFSDYGATGIDSVRVQFTASYLNTGNKSEYNYSQNFYGTATSR
jgi:hypothetical protein